MAHILIFPLPLTVLFVKVFECFVSTKKHGYRIPLWCLKERLPNPPQCYIH